MGRLNRSKKQHNISIENGRIEKPENFLVEGAPRENVFVAGEKVNKKKIAHRLRNCGEQYISPSNGKQMQARKKTLPSCNRQSCKKFGKQCHLLDDEKR